MKKIFIGLLWLGLIGCAEIPHPLGTDDSVSLEPKPDIRRITIEPADNGPVCRVTYPPDPEMKDLRWVAGSDDEACRAMANEALAVFEAKGWSCEPAEPSNETAADRSLVWRCARV